MSSHGPFVRFTGESNSDDKVFLFRILLESVPEEDRDRVGYDKIAHYCTTKLDKTQKRRIKTFFIKTQPQDWEEHFASMYDSGNYDIYYCSKWETNFKLSSENQTTKRGCSQTEPQFINTTKKHKIIDLTIDERQIDECQNKPVDECQDEPIVLDEFYGPLQQPPIVIDTSFIFGENFEEDMASEPNISFINLFGFKNENKELFI